MVSDLGRKKISKRRMRFFRGSQAPLALVTVCASVARAQERQLRSVQRFRGDQIIPRPRSGAHG